MRSLPSLVLCILYSTTFWAQAGASESSPGKDTAVDSSESPQAFKTGFSPNYQGQPRRRHHNALPVDDKLSFNNSIIQSVFDPNNLSGKCSVQIEAKLRSTKPVCKLMTKNANSFDSFYCEQAFWDTAPFVAPEGNVEGVFNFKRTKAARPSSSQIYYEKHPQKEGLGGIIHVMPLSCARFFPSIISSEELKSVANLRMIPAAKLSSPLLRQFREEWVEYIGAKMNNSPTREELLEHGKLMLRKYSKLFS